MEEGRQEKQLLLKKHKEENKNEIVNKEVQREKLEPRHVEEF